MSLVVRRSAGAVGTRRVGALPIAAPARYGGPLVRDFFPMRRDEAVALAILVVASALAFLPSLREVELLGVAAFGWAMAGLMVLSPALALGIILRDRDRGRHRDRDGGGDPEGR